MHFPPNSFLLQSPASICPDFSKAMCRGPRVPAVCADNASIRSLMHPDITPAVCVKAQRWFEWPQYCEGFDHMIQEDNLFTDV